MPCASKPLCRAASTTAKIVALSVGWNGLTQAFKRVGKLIGMRDGGQAGCCLIGCSLLPDANKGRVQLAYVNQHSKAEEECNHSSSALLLHF